jgi:hypothetical protein
MAWSILTCFQVIHLPACFDARLAASLHAFQTVFVSMGIDGLISTVMAVAFIPQRHPATNRQIKLAIARHRQIHAPWMDQASRAHA